jgi:hypothetical protein
MRKKKRLSRSKGLKFIFISNINEPRFIGILAFSLRKVGMPVFLLLQILFQEQNRPTNWPVV